MLRSILLVLDDTAGATAARDAAIALARGTGAALTAAAILDLPHTAAAAEAAPIGTGPYLERRNAALAARQEAEVAAATAAFLAAAGDLRTTVVRLPEAPEPALRQASGAHDLVVIGRDSTLGRDPAEDGLAPAITTLLREAGRPLLICPPAAAFRGAAATGPVLVGYADAVPCRRALHQFLLLGLAPEAPLRLVAVDDDIAAAERLAAAGTALPRSHGRAAQGFGRDGDIAQTLVAEATAHQARLIVVGADVGHGLRVLLFGNDTARLLRDAPCPVLACG